MNRRRIRDHQRIPRRFRFTLASDRYTGVTTWPMLRKDPATGKQTFNRAISVSSVITGKGEYRATD